MTSASVRAQKATSAPSSAKQFTRPGRSPWCRPSPAPADPAAADPSRSSSRTRLRPRSLWCGLMATHEIRIDRSLPLAAEPHTGHNRWHPDIPPALRCEPGDEVVLETRDTFDGAFDRRLRLAKDGRGGRLRPGPSAHRAGARGRGGAGRPPGGRDPRGDPRAVRVHRPGPGVRVPPARLPRRRTWSGGSWPTGGRRPTTFPASASPARRSWASSASPRPGTCWTAATAREAELAARRPRRPRPPARPGRGGARRPGHRRRGAADGPAPGARRQHRHQAADRRHPTAAPGVGRGRAVLGRRRPLRPGRRRVVRHGHRDGRPPCGCGSTSARARRPSGASGRCASSATTPAPPSSPAPAATSPPPGCASAATAATSSRTSPWPPATPSTP